MQSFVSFVRSHSEVPYALMQSTIGTVIDFQGKKVTITGDCASGMDLQDMTLNCHRTLLLTNNDVYARFLDIRYTRWILLSLHPPMVQVQLYA